MDSSGQPQIPGQDDERRKAASTQGDSDPSTLETMAASALPVSAPILNSQALAVLGRRYDILGEAGRGAMGQVYKARDRETGEVVALKILKPEIASDPAMIERFKSELLFARRITHKNVCRVHEFNRVDGVAYTSMEFVEGESLRSVLKRFGSITQRKGIDIALQVCSGLKEAHAQGIVHRDLKPENVMIDTHGNVKIMDFGIARSMETLTLTTGALIGTPAYMAPEQAAGKPVDHRADIYALALMLYEIFTGAQPFRGDNAIAVALKQMNEAPQPPHEIEPSISPSVERAILRGLQKNPDNRFQSVAELESELRSSLPTVKLGLDSSIPTPSAATLNPAAAASAPSTVEASAGRQKGKRRPAATILLIIFLAFAARIAWKHVFPGSGTARVDSENVNISKPGFSLAITPNSVAINEGESAKAPAVPDAKPSNPPATASAHPGGGAAATPGHSRPRSDQSAVSPQALKAPPAAAPPFSPSTESSAAANSQASNSSSASASQNATGSQMVPEPTSASKTGGRFVWVNRFPRQIGAQNAANKIESLGLPVTILPRHSAATNSEFFVVLSGPFPPAEIDTVIEKLKSNGFSLARANGPAATPKSPPSSSRD